MTALLGQKCGGSRFQPMLNWKTTWRCEQMSYSDALMRPRQNTFCQAKGDSVLMRHHYLFTDLAPVVSVNKVIINPWWFILILGFLHTPIWRRRIIFNFLCFLTAVNHAQQNSQERRRSRSPLWCHHTSWWQSSKGSYQQRKRLQWELVWL